MPRPLREMWGPFFLSSETFQDSGGESSPQPTGFQLSLPAKDCLDTRGGGGGGWGGGYTVLPAQIQAAWNAGLGAGYRGRPKGQVFGAR